MKQFIPFSTCIFFLIFICSCSDNSSKKYIKEYYSSGKIKTQGWYVKDTIPVDTLFTFFESGKILAKDIYDSIGNAVKSISYFENGKIHKLINYENGLANGFFYTYFESGNIESKAFFVNDSQVGDTYYYNQTGSIVRAYSFYEWEERPINLIKYDTSTGVVYKDERQVIFIDSIYAHYGRLDKEHECSYDIQIIISNPPKCRSLVKVDYISKNGFVTRTESVTGQPYYFKNQILPDSVITIKLFGSQYDSLTQSTYEQSGTESIKSR